MIEIKRPDKDFDIMTIPDMELFLALKPAIINEIRTVKQFANTADQDVKLSSGDTNRKQVLCADGNLYPHIIIDIAVKSYMSYEHFDLFLDPFSIKLAQHKYDPQMIETDALTASYIDFMTRKFPNSNYQEKRSEYFQKVAVARKVRDELLFF